MNCHDVLGKDSIVASRCFFHSLKFRIFLLLDKCLPKAREFSCSCYLTHNCGGEIDSSLSQEIFWKTESNRQCDHFNSTRRFHIQYRRKKCIRKQKNNSPKKVTIERTKKFLHEKKTCSMNFLYECQSKCNAWCYFIAKDLTREAHNIY